MSFFTTSDGKRLHYTDTGSGRPLLCLAGLTRNGLDFSFVAPHLSDLRLITLDSRGRGQSDNDPDYMNYNVIREGRDAIELLDHLGIDKVTILGTSRGGLLAMALAASHPERLTGVILNDIGPVVGAQGIARIMDYVGKLPRARTLDQAATDMQAALEPEFPGVPIEVWRRQAGYQYAETGDGLALRYDGNLHKALLEQAATGATPDMWMFFEALAKLPLAVIRGANSDILCHDTLTEMQRRHPGLIAAEVPDRGHPPFLDEPEALDAIRALLEQTA
ncbi:alpha/beta fold hydrolase [Pseudodonghicola flavimaris]|uniref:Alpha/beta hydrolase n=1 Tax=Pseudodonghicola flavimaris TaxID=3050036 RepID=A0ABT7EXV1_9RHOB|nr:alpha/beta hydrolase [Pseudodonghicola flavimaris]MDK3017182.1 alpha/beta hydrolase [Pseudodonghicola flavimaris]